MNKKSNQPEDHPTARDPGQLADEIGRTGKMPEGKDDCRGISPEKPIPGCQDGCAGNNIPLDPLRIATTGKGMSIADACNIVEGIPYTGVTFRNESTGPVKPLEFSPLSDEKYRVYCYPDGTIVRLEEPVALNVSKSGGHRVYTADGISHYIPSGWNHLYWEVYEHCNHFAF